jgi:hypothetical protein
VVTRFQVRARTAGFAPELSVTLAARSADPESGEAEYA